MFPGFAFLPLLSLLRKVFRPFCSAEFVLMLLHRWNKLIVHIIVILLISPVPFAFRLRLALVGNPVSYA